MATATIASLRPEKPIITITPSMTMMMMTTVIGDDDDDDDDDGEDDDDDGDDRVERPTMAAMMRGNRSVLQQHASGSR